jgi:hypothetical protein
MRVLRRQLTSAQSASAQRVLTLLGREVSLLDMASSKRIDLWERGWNKLRQTPPQTHANHKTVFPSRYFHSWGDVVCGIVGLSSMVVPRLLRLLHKT